MLVSYQPLLKVPWLLTVWFFNTWASIWWTKKLWKRSSKPKPRSKLTTRKILIAAAPEVQQLPHYPKPEIVLKMENLKANLRKNVKHSCLLLDSRPLRNRNWSNDDPVRKVVKAWIYFHVEIPPNLPWPKTRQITTISLPIWSRPAITLSHLDAEMKLKKIMQDKQKNWRNFSFKKQKTDNNCDWKQQQPCDKKATSRIIFVLSY